eukprot:TCONS_00031083-protein
MKQTLWKTLGTIKPRLEEFKSMMLEVETKMNNKPLGYIEGDIQSTILTPSVMMFDYPVEIPHLDNIEDDLEVSIDLKKRYKYLKNAREKIWQRWSTEYVRYLRERHQLNNNEGSQFKEGDVVIIKGDERNRAHWNLGIIDKIMPGKDGIIRPVRLRAGKNFLDRAPEHLFPLELSVEPKAKKPLPEEVKRKRPRRTAKTIAKLKISDQANEEGNVPLVEL